MVEAWHGAARVLGGPSRAHTCIYHGLTTIPLQARQTASGAYAGRWFFISHLTKKTQWDPPPPPPAPAPAATYMPQSQQAPPQVFYPGLSEKASYLLATQETPKPDVGALCLLFSSFFFSFPT